MADVNKKEVFILSCEPGAVKDSCQHGWSLDFTDEESFDGIITLSVGDILYNVREYIPTSLKGKKGKAYKYIEKDEIVSMTLDKAGWKIKLRGPAPGQIDFNKNFSSIGKSMFVNGEIPKEYQSLRVVKNNKEYQKMVKDLAIND